MYSVFIEGTFPEFFPALPLHCAGARTSSGYTPRSPTTYYPSPNTNYTLYFRPLTCLIITVYICHLHIHLTNGIFTLIPHFKTLP